MRKLFRLLAALAVLGAVLSIMLLSASLYTFARLTDETVIAEVRFERLAPDRYVAYLRTGDFCEEVVLPIDGDQWRIDAEFVKWHYWANLLGLDSQYRLDRFQGRYSEVERENAAAASAHALTPETAVDLVGLAESLGDLNFLVDATYGSSTYQTIATNTVYTVVKSPTGIFTRARPQSRAPASAALAVEIRGGCGDSPGAWERVTAWVDRAATAML